MLIIFALILIFVVLPVAYRAYHRHFYTRTYMRRMERNDLRWKRYRERWF